MLTELRVKNLALIEEAELTFDRGLHILSGETGAGKSLLLGSVSLALGGKAGADMIRQGADSALAELIFTVDNPETVRHLTEMEIPLEEDGTLILQRSIRGGRSVCRINGETFPAGKVREAASLLIDIHGQHESQTLLVKKNHRLILDSFAGQPLAGILEKVSGSYKAYARLKEELESASIDEMEREREIALCEHELAQIREAALTEGEDEELEELFRKLSNGRRILEAAGKCQALIDGSMGDDGAADRIGGALRELRSAESYDSALAQLCAQLSDIDNLMGDFSRELSSYLQDADFSEEEFERASGRLDLINQLKSRYGRTIPEILAYGAQKEAELARLMDHDAYLADLRVRLDAAERELAGLCAEATAARREAAASLKKGLESALLELNFARASFEARITPLGHYTAEGADDVEFLISTNPGEDLKPLAQVASGGELSRIMLALRTITTVRDGIETLIFDEIDAGISGITAAKVAAKLSLLSRSCQVICITHLPQIASYADRHFCIEKDTSGEHTTTRIRALGEEETIEEITRLLGGTEAARENARVMRRDAKAAEIAG